MSTPIQVSILRLNLVPLMLTNITHGRPMGAVSVGGVRTIRSMLHGGIR